MRILLVLGLTGCFGARWPSPPPAGAGSHCGDYDAQPMKYGGLRMCVDHQTAGSDLRDGHVATHPESWSRKGPIEGTDAWGMHVAGWYLGDHREGAWQFTDSHGVVRAEGRYFSGHRDGIWTIRYDNGQIASVLRYENGSKTGAARFWYRDGKPWWRGRYGWMKAVGTWVHWDRDGKRTEIAAEPGLHAETGTRVDAVGPLAERSDFAGENDLECPYSFATLKWALDVRGDGLATGTLREDGSGGDIVDENGVPVLRGDTRSPECYDVGGRRVLGNNSYSRYFP